MANITYTLFENFELSGIWWLPDNPERKISGAVSFQNEDKITLDLIGSFRDLPPLGGIEVFQPELILGITDNGKICTLYRNYEIESRLSSPGFLKSIFEANYLFIGKHYKSPEEIRFSSVQANFTNLESWIGQQPFKMNFSKEEYSILYTVPSDFESLIPALNATIRSTSNFNTYEEQFKKAVWQHTAFLRVAPDDWQDFMWFWKIIYNLNNFLTLLVGQTIYIKRLIGFGDDIQVKKDLKIKESIEVFYAQKKPNVKDKIFIFDMIVPLPRVFDDITDILQLWFSKMDTLRSVYDLFFGTFYNPSMYLQFHFLALTQAIESFHRVTIGGKYLSNNDWETHRATISNCIPNTLESSHKQSLENRIKYGNEYSLRKRMQDLIDSLHTEVLEAITPSKKYYSGVIVDTRHYLTHYDDDLKENALDGTELFYANERLKILLIILLMKEIGIDERHVIEALRKNPRYRDILDMIRREKIQTNDEK